jgi:hypothetical protein
VVVATMLAVLIGRAPLRRHSTILVRRLAMTPGLSLFHEFEPGIRQMVKDHTPRFAFRIEERITRNQHHLKEVVSSPAR